MLTKNILITGEQLEGGEGLPLKKERGYGIIQTLENMMGAFRELLHKSNIHTPIRSPN